MESFIMKKENKKLKCFGRFRNGFYSEQKNCIACIKFKDCMFETNKARLLRKKLKLKQQMVEYADNLKNKSNVEYPEKYLV
jgi:hypothetical protein